MLIALPIVKAKLPQSRGFTRQVTPQARERFTVYALRIWKFGMTTDCINQSYSINTTVLLGPRIMTHRKTTTTTTIQLCFTDVLFPAVDGRRHGLRGGHERGRRRRLRPAAAASRPRPRPPRLRPLATPTRAEEDAGHHPQPGPAGKEPTD